MDAPVPELEIVTELLCRYGSLYAPQLFLLATLSAITVYRREFSCNHCYAEDEESKEEDSKEEGDGTEENDKTSPLTPTTMAANSTTSHSSYCSWDDAETEKLLEGLGLYWGSGASTLLPLLLGLVEHAERARQQGLVMAEDLFVQGAEKLASMSMAQHECEMSSSTTRAKRTGAPSAASAATIISCAQAPEKEDKLSCSEEPVPVEEGESATTSHPCSAAEPQHQEEASSDDDLNLCSTTLFPADAQVHILSFLHPRDICQFACASRACLQIVQGGYNDDGDDETSTALWKTLWQRDYSWIVTSWDVGREALERSGVVNPNLLFDNDNNNNNQFLFTKEFYFRFGLSYLNYVLAGQNTMDRCLVGLGGHIYDMSHFLSSHPGSPETVMVQAGKDATAFFSSVRHSMGARRLAQTLCVVVDTARLQLEGVGYGLRPTAQTELTLQNGGGDDMRIVPAATTASSSPSPKIVAAPPLFMETQQPGNGRAGTLYAVRAEFLQQQQRAQEQAARQLVIHNLAALGEVNVYYDCFRGEWRAWYMNMELENVFTHLE